MAFLHPQIPTLAEKKHRKKPFKELWLFQCLVILLACSFAPFELAVSVFLRKSVLALLEVLGCSELTVSDGSRLMFKQEVFSCGFGTDVIAVKLGAELTQSSSVFLGCLRPDLALPLAFCRISLKL